MMESEEVSTRSHRRKEGTPPRGTIKDSSKGARGCQVAVCASLSLRVSGVIRDVILIPLEP